MKEIDNKLTQKFDEYPSFGVLKGVKVFVTGTNIAGPFAGCLMAEMGAKVLQAEAPTIACQTRGTLAWSQNHRNEYSIRQPRRQEDLPQVHRVGRHLDRGRPSWLLRQARPDR